MIWRSCVIALIVLCVSCGELAPPISEAPEGEVAQPVASNQDLQRVRANPDQFLATALSHYRNGQHAAAIEILELIENDSLALQRVSQEGEFFAAALNSHIGLDNAEDLSHQIQTLQPRSPQQRFVALELWGRYLSTRGRVFESSVAFYQAKDLNKTHGFSSNDKLNTHLWQLVTSVPSQQIATIQQQVGDDELRQWWEIAAQFNSSLSLAGWQVTWERWRQTHPNHESTKWLPTYFGDRSKGPKHIAVLLPQSGDDVYAQASRGIRDGWMLAYVTDARRANPNDLPTFSFVDTVDIDPQRAIIDAFAAGADCVVGPLTKDSVNAVYAHNRYAGPVLMLNDPDVRRSTQASPIRYLAWSIEDEAKTMAQTLSSNPQLRSVLIYGDEPWMIRARSEFELNLREPARVIAVNRVGDFEQLTDVIGSSLGIEDSFQRHDRIESILNFQLEFQPRVNKEVNSIVAFIDSTQLEAVLESVRFHADRELDVYVTDSAVRGQLPELANGIKFTTDAWRIHESSFASQVSEHFDAGANMASFYALGIDAYRLSNLWSLMSESKSLVGSAGRYQLEPNGDIRRLPLWGVVENQRLIPLVPPSLTTEKQPFL